MRKSTVTAQTDSAGLYETEVFEVPKPRAIVVCSHGNGVRRWDGEHFFHHLAEHYPQHTFLLVDQNQPIDDGCKLNDLSIMTARVQGLIALARQNYPDVPVVVIGHSMGCGIVSQLDLSGVAKAIFVAPAAGDAAQKLIERYGPDVANGKLTKTKDGLTKLVSKEYFDSIQGIVWEEEYKKLLQHFGQVHVFESGDEQIVGDERKAHRDMPFASYRIIPGAKHDYSGEALPTLLLELDKLL